MKKAQFFLLTLLLTLTGALGANAQTKEAYYSVEYLDEDYDEFDNLSYRACRYVFYYDDQRATRGRTRNVTQNGTPLDFSTEYVIEFIKRVVFDSSFADYRPKNTSHWFEGLSDATLYFEGMENLNTSEVTNMSYMFSNVSGRSIELDLTHFDTSNVTNMEYMFSNMNDESFADLSLDLSSFTFNPSTNTTGFMKNSCLFALTVPASANNLASDAFQGVHYGNGGYYDCYLFAPDGFTPQGATLDYGYYSFAWKGGRFCYKNGKLAYCRLEGEYNEPTIRYDNDFVAISDIIVPDDGQPIRYTDESGGEFSTIIDAFKFEDSFADYRPTNTSHWFENRGDLFGAYSEFYLKHMENLNTSEVTDMSYMFYNSKYGNGGIDLGEPEFDLSHFDTRKVTNMSHMFERFIKAKDIVLSENSTYALGTLDISSFTINTTTNTDCMFKDAKIGTLIIPASANRLAANAFTGVGTQASPCTLIYPDGFTPQGASTPDENGVFIWKGGYFKEAVIEPYAVLDGSTLTFYYDKQRTSRGGTTYGLNTGSNYPGWFDNHSSVTSVVFDPSFQDARPTSCAYWFAGMSNLTTITGISYLNTSEVETMFCMFDACKSLTSIDASHFDTSKVKSMVAMFGECPKLESITFGDGFDTSKVTGEFNNYGGFFGMFAADTSLTTLDLSRFTFSESAETSSLLQRCSALSTLIVPETANRLAANAFNGVGTETAPCTLIYPSELVLEPTSAGDGWYLWKGGFFKDAETEAYAVFDGSTLTFYLDKSRALKPGTSYDMDLIWGIVPRWADVRPSVEAVVFTPAFINYRPSSCYNWFYGMSMLSSVTGLEYLNTADVTNMSCMFQNCSKLTNLDLRNFDVSNVTNMSFMFNSCSSLESLDLSSFNTANATTFQDMFSGCSSLTSLNLSNFNTEKVTSMQNMFSRCSNLTSLDISSFNTAKVTNMGSMFQNCSSMTSIDISHFILKPTNYFSNMFNGCSSLTSLDLINFSFLSKVDYYSTKMLYNCTSLKTLTIPASADKLWDDAFSGVGSEANPCTLIYPDELVLEPTSTGDGWFLWKEGYFKDANEVMMGDANGDGSVSVVDVMMTVNYVLGLNPEGFHFNNANVVDDNAISVTDVMGIVSIVLGKTNSQAPAQSRTSAVDGIGITANSGICTVALDNSEPFNALQFTIVMPEKAKLGNVAMMQARANGHQVKAQAVAPGRYNMVVFATSGAPLRDGTTALLHFDFTGCQPGDIAIEGVQLVNSQYETILPTGIVTDITGIEMDGDADSQPYYNTVGIGVKTPTRGVYVKNGKKVVVK